MTWRETNGTRPRVKADKLYVKFRNGLCSKTPYTVKTTRWEYRGDNDPWDVVAYAVPDEEARAA